MHIGIIGGGQLGRMLALAGIPLGFTFRGIEPTSNSPMGQVAPQILAPYDDTAGLDELARDADVITYEFENVPVKTARQLAQRVPVYPPPQALEVSQDRWHEKSFFRQHDIPTPAFAKVDNADGLATALAAAIEQIGGLPCVLKTRRLGYDGKGQWVLKSAADVAAASAEMRGQPAASGYIVEAWVPFVRELSILAVRGTTGELAFYPLVQNTHREGILRLSIVPATNAPEALAQDYAARVLNALDYVGVLAIEFFDLGDGAGNGQLIANEMAPRVHNSGHWTQDGAVTSQFENHLRAITGLPLGTTHMRGGDRGHAAMVNLIGTVPDTRAVLKIPDAHLHLYGKAPRPGRKLGHINVVAEDEQTLHERVTQAQALLAK